MTQTSQHAFGFQRPQLSARRACRVQDVAALCDALTSNTRLSELSCSCHPLSPGAAARFGAALAANGALRSVSVGDSSFGDAGLAAMAGGLAANKGLTRLDLEHKALTAAGARALAACLAAHPTLQELLIGRNELGTDGVSALCVPWRALRALDLSSCGLGAPAVAALAAAPALGTLAQLALADNELGPGAGAPLAELLGRAGKLRVLELAGTRLGEEGVATLASALPSAPGLAALDLSRCGMSAAGVRALAGGLRRQAAAGPLRLVLGPGNDLGHESVVELAAALQERARSGDSQHGDKGQQQQQQQRGREAVNYDLDLGGGDLGLAAVQALARLPGLEGLALFRAALSDAAVAALCGAVAASGGEGGGEGHAEERQFAGLRNLNLSGCGLGLASLKQLLAALERAGAGSPLRLVEVGANPGADEAEFHEAAAALKAARPELDVHWRAADGSSEGAGQVGGGGLRLQAAAPGP
ncbi:hypothetical protein MNEG_10436 [Monoraphidium neglectum]|uniref:Protein NLRC3 n=1 Tax=Monoraphidium neglectum TaxID=145388 RepID=A0A0D2MSM6_9CHLO|nr:hypothetical protein MNEG_10436 [Monoraphidium neglectum]KIY97525.1 hypothetical protein MNEG_10436 [Monoraphidium neglectum]|eukprot:XP_013896545.1 hypothetical protein MNEG_10436 [Monoraphidium neglectum]